MNRTYIKGQMSVTISVVVDKPDKTIVGWYSWVIKTLITGRASKSNYSHKRDDAQ
jgi:hypothetical protein